MAVDGSEVFRLPKRGGERDTADDVDVGGGYVFEISAWMGWGWVCAGVRGSCVVLAVCKTSGDGRVKLSGEVASGVRLSLIHI